MQITKEFLQEHNACRAGYEWWIENCEGLPTDEQIKKLALYHNDWANWLLVRVLSHDQRVQYAIFAAEQVLSIFEARYPDDKRPREAIEAARLCLSEPSKLDDHAAADAAYVAAYAAYAAYAADAAYAAYAAYAAAYAAVRAAYAAYAADAADVAYVAAYAAEDTKKMQNKILEYGFSLLSEGAQK